MAQIDGGSENWISMLGNSFSDEFLISLFDQLPEARWNDVFERSRTHYSESGLHVMSALDCGVFDGI